MSTLRLMTHNQWKNDKNQPDWEKIGEDCSVGVRAKGFLRVYRDTMPDMVGGQEVSAKMVEELICGLADEGMKYALLWGRDTPIMYRQDKFELVDSDFALYPEEFPGHEGVFNNGKTKSYSIGVFRIKESGKLFIFASTHLWWKNENPASPNYQPHSHAARGYQMGLLIVRIDELQKKYDCPAVIVGDLNAGYNSLAVKCAFENGFVHAHDVATDYVDEAVGYHACFGWGYDKFFADRPFETAIDHILLRGAPEGAVKRFERFSPEYYLPLSDHSPAFIDIEL